MLRAIELKNGNSIIYLQSKTFGFIVDQNNIFKRSIFYNSEILDEFSSSSLKTMISAKEILDDFFVRIQFFNNSFSIIFCGCSKYVNVIIFGNVREKLFCIRSDMHFKCNLTWFYFGSRIFFCENQGLI